MKALKFLMISALAAGFYGCYSDDDGYSRDVHLSLTDAVRFDGQNEYVVGDTLFFEIRFSRYLEEDGYDTLLDVFETTGSEEFRYGFGISKYSEFTDAFEWIEVDGQFVIGVGPNSPSYGYNTEMVARLDAAQKEYTSRVGVILPEAGRFKIELGGLSLVSGNFFDYDFENVSVRIEHTLSPEDEAAAEFTVVENGE